MFKVLLVLCELGMPDRVCTPTGDHLELVEMPMEYRTVEECYKAGMHLAAIHLTPMIYGKVYCLPLKGEPV